jgi:hypothetical protein
MYSRDCSINTVFLEYRYGLYQHRFFDKLRMSEKPYTFNFQFSTIMSFTSGNILALDRGKRYI